MVELTPPKKQNTMSEMNPDDFIQSEQTISNLKRKTSLKLRGEMAKRLRLEPPPLDRHKSIAEYTEYAREVFPGREKLNVVLPCTDVFDVIDEHYSEFDVLF